jgi:UDP-glucuronate 4-epimerase
LGDGGVRRDFTHVSDTVEGICRLADDLFRRPPGFYDIVNVGGGNTRSMTHLISTIENLTGSRIDHDQTLRDFRDVAETEADFAYLQELTGFRPTVQLEEGLIEAIEWARQPEVLSKLRGWIENRQLQ